jgi:CheY-like chemotaxis protein
LLAFGRRQAIKPRVVDPNLRLDALSEMLVRTLGSRVEVKLELSATGNIEVDEAQFETAILNAAFNARDAMPDGGRLTIASRDEERDGEPYIRVCIGDTGDGMSDEVRERAFEPFFTTKDVGKGTGLGLSQIHGFAAQAGGTSHIESAPGEGTTISIWLPRSGDAAGSRVETARERRIPEGLKLLVVEDNPKVQQFACDLLRDLGCDVRSADTGSEALELLKDNEFDLVMSDIVMPGMSGLELARLVGASRSPVPVVLATGYSSELVEGQHHFPVIAKPYGVDDVVEAIARVIRKPERT